MAWDYDGIFENLLFILRLFYNYNTYITKEIYDIIKQNEIKINYSIAQQKITDLSCTSW